MTFNLEGWLSDRQKPGKLAHIIRRLCDRRTPQKSVISVIRTYYLAEQLFRNEGNASAVAREMVVSRNYIIVAMEKLGIDKLEIALAARKAKQQK